LETPEKAPSIKCPEFQIKLEAAALCLDVEEPKYAKTRL
jgi:hypothetical protein